MAENGDNIDSLITQFKEVCAVTDDVATQFLEHHEWNLEEALHTFFRNEGTLPENGHSSVRRRFVDSPSTSDSSLDESDSRLHAPDNRESSNENHRDEVNPNGILFNIFGWVKSIVFFPFRAAHLSVLAFYDLLMSFLYLFRNPSLSVSDPRGDVNLFVDNFNDKYRRCANRIDWNRGSYNDVLQESKQSLRFVLVYLHSDHHQDTDQFVREKLLSEPTRLFVERNNLLMWGASVKTAEGYKVSMALRTTTFPFLALIGMRDNRMAMLVRVEGDRDLEPMLYTMQSTIDQNVGQFNALRESRLQQDINSRLRREQELEYERALAEDRAKETERKRLESERLEAERIEQDERDALLLKKKLLEEKKELIRTTIPEEPSSDDCIRVNIRFPSGAKLERRFVSTASLEDLFNITLCHESCPDDFSLLSSYPRKQLHCYPEWYRQFGTCDSEVTPIPTFAEAGFPKATVVLVQDNEA